MSTYNKPYLSFEQQLYLLQSRGLNVSDKDADLSCLKRVGYYRLSAYWYPLRKKSSQPNMQRGDDFYPGYTFEQVFSLYVFDKRLRLLILDAIERIEVALRVDIAYQLGSHDPFAHMKPELLHGNFTKKQGRNGLTDYQIWLKKHDEVVKRSKEDFVKHYKRKYGEPFPIWVSVELWDFGLLSHFYKGMAVADRNIIASRYGLPDHNLLGSWMRSLNFVRNVAAHHSRLWNKNLVDQPKLPKKGEILAFDPLVGQHAIGSRPFIVLCILLHMMQQVSPNSSWPARVRHLLSEFPDIPGLSLNDMGFMDGWENQPLWEER